MPSATIKIQGTESDPGGSEGRVQGQSLQRLCRQGLDPLGKRIWAVCVWGLPLMGGPVREASIFATRTDSQTPRFLSHTILRAVVADRATIGHSSVRTCVPACSKQYSSKRREHRRRIFSLGDMVQVNDRSYGLALYAEHVPSLDS